MTPTVWPARRVRERILCGRQVDGRYVCQGFIAPVAYFVDKPRARRPSTSTVIEEQADGSIHLRETTRPRPPRNTPDGWTRWPLLKDFTRECPHCKCTAQVNSTVLESKQ